MKHISLDGYLAALEAARQPYHAHYYAMYSSLLGGVVTHPVLMQIPIDDHLVHRGDGVFDTLKCVNGAMYNVDAHLRRLERSAAAIGIRWPGGFDEIRALTLETIRAGGQRMCSCRVMLARGPGGFGVNPYEPPGPALYIIAYKLGPPFMDIHPGGARVRRSRVPAKPSQFAEIKNCNYLPNVLMKREAVDWGVDFVVGYDVDDHLTEGATENVGLITRSGELVFPRRENILEGTSMLRLMELARDQVNAGALKAVVRRDISEQELFDAAEVLIVGTTINVVAVVEYEGRAIGTGYPGTGWRLLNDLLERDIAENGVLRTAVF